jgi:hypothetical protein
MQTSITAEDTMAKPGKPRKEGASGRHDYTSDESLTFWQARWRAEFEALPPKKQAEERARIGRLLATAPAGSPLRAYAAACGIGDGDGDGDGICN